ncbi:MAG TPA: hypothetical protein ENL00_00085 [Nitratifractor sp.]|nr:hypothetical protein [Nitratifractor sp.]
MQLNIYRLLYILAFCILSLRAEYIETYYAKLAKIDHLNSKDEKLYSVATILYQDRYNVNIRGIRQKGDESDLYFEKKNNRDKLSKMLRNGVISESARRLIISSYPYVKVDVFSDHINVKVLRKRTFRTGEVLSGSIN